MIWNAVSTATSRLRLQTLLCLMWEWWRVCTRQITTVSWFSLREPGYSHVCRYVNRLILHLRSILDILWLYGSKQTTSCRNLGRRDLKWPPLSSSHSAAFVLHMSACNKPIRNQTLHTQESKFFTCNVTPPPIKVSQKTFYPPLLSHILNRTTYSTQPHLSRSSTSPTQFIHHIVTNLEIDVVVRHRLWPTFY